MTKSIGTILVGEVGPVATRLALCGLDMGHPMVVLEELVPHRELTGHGPAGLGPLVQAFLQKYRPPRIRTASFIVSGPVADGVSLAANLPWPVDAGGISAELGIDKVTVLNDVEAIAHGVPALAADDLVVLAKGDAPEQGNQAIVSVGACPGMSGSQWNGTEHVSFVSYGAHADFAPSCDEELQLALDVGAQVARLSVELLLSNAGLALIYRHLRSRSGEPEPAELSEALRSDDPSVIILREAEHDVVCRRAVDRFLSIFGSAAGNLALTLHATGGVYLAGELVLRLRDALTNGVFQEAFNRKAPMQPFLTKVPLYAIVNERAALLGAATVAAREMRARHAGGWAS